MLPKNVLKQAKIEAAREGVGMSEIVRRALERYLPKIVRAIVQEAPQKVLQMKVKIEPDGQKGRNELPQKRKGNKMRGKRAALRH
jgi:hypothetical protein